MFSGLVLPFTLSLWPFWLKYLKVVSLWTSLSKRHRQPRAKVWLCCPVGEGTSPWCSCHLKTFGSSVFSGFFTLREEFSQ